MKLISVIIPAYKAEKFIVKTLADVKRTLDQIRYRYEIICVVDGKVDNTYEKAGEFASRFPRKIKVFGYKNNLGKGHAVKYGMAKAKGDIIGFIDAGLDINPNAISMLLDHFEWYDADIIVGSKRHPVSKVKYPWQRKIVSFFSQILIGILFGLKVKDTQAGVKFFKKGVLNKVMPRLLVKRWAFDIEMLAVSHYLGFKRIYEAPIELKLEFGGLSTVTSSGFIKVLWGTFLDTLAVFYRLYILRFYDYKNRKNWIIPKYLKLGKNK